MVADNSQDGDGPQAIDIRAVLLLVVKSRPGCVGAVGRDYRYQVTFPLVAVRSVASSEYFKAFNRPNDLSHLHSWTVQQTPRNRIMHPSRSSDRSSSLRVVAG